MELDSSPAATSPNGTWANGRGVHSIQKHMNGNAGKSSQVEGKVKAGIELDKAIADGGAQVGRHHSTHSQSAQSTRSRSSSLSHTTHFQHKQNKPQKLLKSLKHLSERAKKTLHLNGGHEEQEHDEHSGDGEAVKRRGSERCHPHYHQHRAHKHEMISEEDEGEGHQGHEKEKTKMVGNGGGGVLLVDSGRLQQQQQQEAEGDKFEERRNIKIRLVTWNMHDSLPSGDLSDFLGEVKNWKDYTGSSGTSDNKRKSTSGGSRESSEGRRRRSSMTGSKKSIGTTGESVGGRGSVISLPSIGPEALPPFPLTPEHPYHLIVVAGQECPTASGVTSGKLPRTWDGQGWTTILEEWLCGTTSEDSDSDSSSDGEADAGENRSRRRRSGERGRVSESDEGGGISGGLKLEGLNSSKSSRTGTVGGAGEGASLKSRGNSTVISGKERDGTVNGDTEARRNGPYILVEKERLLGIYLAVFVARNCDGLIEGISKARVPAGLIGGRVGNKGACGISLNFAGSRLLFISAHLAAHASGLEIRKMNVKKIMEELEVDDFRGNTGKSEGKTLSDRFDQTFFLGDLNMRLNITRLHADWLTKSQDYATALQFDQLRGVLAEENSCLKGFQEAPITFAPTYKYDVVSKVKRKRSEAVPRSPRSPTRKTVVQPAVIDVFDMDPLTTVPTAATDPELPPAAARDPDNVSLVDSIASAMSDYDRIDKADLVALGLPSAPSKGGETSMDAVRRAQVKFLTLVRANSSAAILNHSATSSGASTPRRNLPAKLSARPILRSAQSELVVPLARNTPPRSTDVSDEESEDEAAAPCFDSSSKQRVQSYTDRILFKSTVGYGTADTTSPSKNLGVDFVDTLRARRRQSIPPVVSNDPLSPQHPHHPLLPHRPVLDHASKKVGTSSDEQSWSDVASVAGEPRHRRFANFFGRGHRRGLAEPTADTFTSPPPSPTDTRIPTTGRSASFTPNYSMSRRASFVAPPRQSSVQFDLASSPSARPDTAARTSSGSALPAVTSSPTLTSFPFSSASNTSTAPTTPAPAPSPSSSPRINSSPRKTQRSFSMAESTLTGRPILSPNSDSDPLIFPRRMSLDPTVQFDQGDSSLSTFIRSNALSLTRTFTRTQSRATTVTPHNRFKSFFHMIPLPFLSTTRSATETELESKKPLPREKIGPKKGEIQALLYGAVADLNKMGAQSDHRPVFSVVAIGVEDNED